MKHLFAKTLIGSALAGIASFAIAGTDPYFTPLTQSSAVAPPNHINELNSPWQIPGGISQTNLMSLAEVEADMTQSVGRAVRDGRGGEPGSSASMFDMLAFDPTGRYVYIPHESPVGAGISRYDRHADRTELLFVGNQEGNRDDANGSSWDNDFGAFDPARFTPNGTVIAAEEWSGQGRVVEIKNPYGAAPADPVAGGADLVEGSDWRVLTSIARVSHEGINFSVKQPHKVIYYVDEDRSGSIYKLVLQEANNYAAGGQTFVLKTVGFTGNPAERWDGSGSTDSDTNQDPAVQASRFGKAQWVPITNAKGEPLEGISNPFNNDDTDSSRPGRVAADDAGGTPFGRPEDMTIGNSKHGNELIFVATTSESAVISIEEIGGGYAMVRQFASEAETPKNEGFLPTTGTLNSPDNLAIDALGNIYIIEDAPNGSDVGGDIWFARDTDNDGVAESLDHFMSVQVDGAEATGMIFNPREPHKFVVAVQHPDSTNLANVPDGFGDALWEFDIKNVTPPLCEKKQRKNAYFGKHKVRTCTRAWDVNFNRSLRKAGRSDSDFQP